MKLLVEIILLGIDAVIWLQVLLLGLAVHWR
jgi:hypothetical protein